MIIIPAIDLKGGKCVRLRQGKDDDTTEYSSDPVAVAEEWVRQGAKRLHIVNLDGAFGRASNHLEVLKGIVLHARAEVEYGGGLRTPEDVEQAFAAGCHKVVLGTMAMESEEFLRRVLERHGTDRVIVALDARAGRVATRGWEGLTDETPVNAAVRLQKAGVSEILYTDVSRDGMFSGPDTETLRILCDCGVRVIASGGVASADDVRRIVELGQPNLIGVIVGKALYDGRVSVPALLAAALRH